MDVKIDVDRMTGGKEVIERFGTPRGVPWLAILSPEGKVLITGDDPEKGNIGSPQADWEIEHWNTMIRTTAKRITEAEIQHMAKTLAEDRPAPRPPRR